MQRRDREAKDELDRMKDKPQMQSQDRSARVDGMNSSLSLFNHLFLGIPNVRKATVGIAWAYLDRHSASRM